MKRKPTEVSSLSFQAVRDMLAGGFFVSGFLKTVTACSARMGRLIDGQEETP